MDFQEYTGWKIEKAKAARNAKIKAFVVNFVLAIAGAICLYGLLWLGAFLDYCAGV